VTRESLRSYQDLEQGSFCRTVVAAPAASTACRPIPDLREFLSSSSLKPSIGAGISEEITDAHLWLLFDECVDEPENHDKRISFSEELMRKDRIEDLAPEDALYPVTVLRQRLDLRFDKIEGPKNKCTFSLICACGGISCCTWLVDGLRLASARGEVPIVPTS
jgi:hypothetical protein